MTGLSRLVVVVGIGLLPMSLAGSAIAGEDWPQFKFDCRNSGNVPDRVVEPPLGLLAAVPLTDAVLTAPVVADGRVYVVDGSGVASCIDAETFEVLWRFESPGGEVNCNNVSSPAIVDGYLHFGTTAGSYFVLDAHDGSVVNEIRCGEPIFSAPVVGDSRVYFATLGSRVYAVTASGEVCWTWDFVREVLGFDGNRWDGRAWLAHNNGRVTWRNAFCCAFDIAWHDGKVVVPAGGRIVWLDDAGDTAKLTTVGTIPSYVGKEYPAAFGQAISEDGAVHVQ